jgi:transposase
MPDPQYDFVPVDHDPHAVDFVPVSHDPFATAQSDSPLAGLLAGEPQRQSRSEILSQTLDKLRDFLTPGYLRDSPSSPQADRALADPNAKPGKIGPPSGPPTTAQMIGGLGADVATNALPFGKLLATIPFWVKAPAKAAQVDELIAKGLSEQNIADKVGLSRSAVQGYLRNSKQKTAAAENLADNPYFWDANPGSVDQLKAMKLQGMSHPAIAQKFGTSVDVVAEKVRRMLAAGELPDSVRRPPSFQESPERQARLKELHAQGWSWTQMQRDPILMGRDASGERDASQVRGWIKWMQDRGEMLDAAPQGRRGYAGAAIGLTPAGRTPTLPQTKFMQGPDPEDDPEATKALIQYLRSLGLHASLLGQSSSLFG